MIRGLFTSASGMVALQEKMNVIANNLANVDTTGFKEDRVVFKAFPEMLIHRTNDDGVGWTPLGSFDIAPVVGKLGTGVEVNEVYTQFTQGPLKPTSREADLAIHGEGFFVIQTDRGLRLTRKGSFIVNEKGYLTTPQGFPLMGEKGPIQVARHNFIVKPNGEVWINQKIGNDPNEVWGKDQNDWEEMVFLDRIQIRVVDYPRYLYKEGDSFYAPTVESGEPAEPPPERFPEILQGYLEASNVNLVREIVDMIEVQRQFEMNQKSLTTQDALLGRLINEVAR